MVQKVQKMVQCSAENGAESLAVSFRVHHFKATCHYWLHTNVGS
jgi:hypothetical protein